MGWRERMESIPLTQNAQYTQNLVDKGVFEDFEGFEHRVENGKRWFHGIALFELELIAGPDWQQVQVEPALLEGLANSIQARRMRECGQRPDHYTQLSTCRHCGPVWLWAGVPQYVQGCPWCFNRLKGLPIPYAKPVIQPDIAGD